MTFGSRDKPIEVNRNCGEIDGKYTENAQYKTALCDAIWDCKGP